MVGSSPASLRQFLAQVSPFKGLPSAELDRLVSLSKEKHYDKGETVYTEGGLADSVWIIREGRVQIFKYTSNGRPHAIENLGPKELFGTLCRLGSQGQTYPCTAVASTSCTIVQILERTFLDFYNRFPAMVRGVCSLCSLRLNAIQGLSCAAQEPVEKRIATILLQLRKTHGDTLPFTKREVAELAGTTVETTIRTVSSFSKKGWVDSARGRIHLKSPSHIRRLLDVVC
jgi:CRP/FNR family transcriptional regulator